MDLNDLIDEAETLHEMMGDYLTRLKSQAPMLSTTSSLASPVAACHPSAARNSSRYEQEDVLPPGKLKHSPYARMSRAEGRAFALDVLKRCGDWVIPLTYSEQHYDTVAAQRYFKGLLRSHFKALAEEGIVEIRAAHRRGANYKYRLKPGIEV